jgi:hypothetical protein
MKSLSAEAAKPIFVGILGLLFAVVIGSILGSESYWTLAIGALIFAIIGLWFGTGQWFWPIVIASSYLGGTFPLLRGSFTPFHILMGLGVAKFFVEDVILRRASFVRIDRWQLIFLAGFMAVLTWHGMHDRFGMRFLGSEVWGGRNYVSVYVGLVAFFVVQSTSVKSELWNKLPYLILAVTGFDLVIATITTISPVLIFYIYPLYSAVGTAGITELLTGDEDVAGRIGAFGNFGCILTMIVLASISMRQFFHPKNFWRLVTLSFASLLVVYSGFRSALANWLSAFLLAGFRDIRFRMVALLPILAALLFTLTAIHATAIKLPKQMQRTLTFLPGDWDMDIARDARASNEFRETIWKMWWHDYFPRWPLIGRGFGFRSEWTKTSIYIPTGTDYQQMVEVGNIHNGLFASLDAIGIIGTVFFVGWSIQLFIRAARVTFDKSNPSGFALRFLALQIGVSIMCYWFGATTLGTFLPQQFAVAGVFLRLYREAYPQPDRVRDTPQPIIQDRRRVPVAAQRA